MKTMRRIITLALAALLVLALALPAFAATEKGSIAVTRTEAGTGITYAIYQIFDTNPVNGGHTYKLTADWANFTAPGYFEVNENDYVVWKKNTTSVADAAAVAQLAKVYAVANNLTAIGTVVAGGTAVEVDTGYYLLMPVDAEGKAVDSPSGVIMVEAGEDATVQEKTTASGHPKVEKKVLEDSTNTYKEFNSVDAGQTIHYQTTITAGVNPEKYVLHDKMDEHIEYTNAFVLLRDGNPLPQVNNYEIVDDRNALDSEWDCGCTFHVVFLEGLLKDLHEGAKIVVQYTGKLKGTADPETAHKNETWLTYQTGALTDKASTSTAMFKITITKLGKKDDQVIPLENAGFLLRDNIGKYYCVDTEGNVTWGDKVNATMMKTDSSGIAIFSGLDAENFVLEEVVVPDGYTGSTDVSVSTKVGDQGEGKNAEVTITNTLGEALPETGGIGTTVFYVVGILLIVGALAMLVVFKRRTTEQ